MRTSTHRTARRKEDRSQRRIGQNRKDRTSLQTEDRRRHKKMTMTTLEKTVLKDLHLKNTLLRTSDCSKRTRLECSKDKTDVEKETLKNFDLELINI